jgi:hypothetical protein
MQVYVKWPGSELYRGPYKTVSGYQVHYLIDCDWDGVNVSTRVPKSAVFPLTDGWKPWTGAGKLPEGLVSKILYRDGSVVEDWAKITVVADEWEYGWPDEEMDIIAYRIAEREEPATIPLSTIMDRSLWWLDDDNTWRSVECWDMFDGTPLYGLRGRRVDLWVGRDWFTGREHKRGEDFDYE